MTEPDKRVEYRGTGFWLGWISVLLVASALFVLAVQNTQEVDIAFLGWEFSVPLFAVAIGAALLAIVLDELIGLVWRRQRRLRLEERAELDRLRAAGARTGTHERRDEEGMEPGTPEPEMPPVTPPPTLGDEVEDRAEDHDEQGESA